MPLELPNSLLRHQHAFYAVMLSLLAGALHTTAAPPAAPTGLRVNDVTNPVGTASDVYFGWRVNDADQNEVQQAWQVVVASTKEDLARNSGDVWDSGKVLDRQQSHVPYVGAPLKCDHRYYWRVRTWDKEGSPSPWSAPARFDVGMLTNDDWNGASWIRRESRDKDDHTRFRRPVSLPEKPIERAIVYISATHRFDLRVNGTHVGKGQAYHYPDRQYYHAYEITNLLQPTATNVFAVRTHWFGGGQGRPAGKRGVILKAVIHHSDGSTTVVGTNEHWRQSRADAWVLDNLVPRQRGEGVGYVERIDGRRLRPDWDLPGFDDSNWQAATVIGPHPVAPWSGTLSPDLTRIVETTIKPKSVTRLNKDKYLVDLGKVWAGMPRIRFSGGTTGEVVTMRGGYELNTAGEIPLGTKSQSTNMEYRAILSGDEFTYAPVEYLGMRYFQIDNAPMPVTAENFSFVTRHSALDRDSSSFDSSDPTLNAVWELMKHSLFTCAQEEFVDTPTREKGGFLGDAAIQSQVAMPVLHERTLTRRVLAEYLDSMDRYWFRPADRGRINAVYPNNDGARDIPDFTQAYLPWVWSYYLETGDLEFLVASWPKLQSIGGYLDRHTNAETGLVTQLTGGAGPYEFGIIDWPPPMRYGYDTNTDARTVVNAWAIADFDALANIADVLGDSESARAYRKRTAALKKAVNQWLTGASGLYVDGISLSGKGSQNRSQHANMFPLALKMVPDQHRKVVVAAVGEKGMSVGMVTVCWLIRALGEAGQGEQLLDLYTNADQPGWARCLKLGATATWESWDANQTGQSQSHAWGAAGLEGYVRYILGVRPTKPQYEEVRIQPLDFGDRLTWAKGQITTDRGPITVHWQRNDGQYVLRLELPVNVTAEVALPKGHNANSRVSLDGKEFESETVGNHLIVRGVGSGRHTVTRRTTAWPPSPSGPNSR